MSLKVAVLGASGFIGSRIIEMFHLRRMVETRPIVRSYASLARLSRFQLDWRIADAFDHNALRKAFEGCQVVIHSIAGDPQTILGTLAPVYRAAEEAGVRRLIYLSSASVHGQAPSPGTDESSRLNEKQSLPYNTAKIRAERKLLQLHKKGSVELVILRPGIVFGPRSSWIGNFADSLLAGDAYLVNQGKGICNSIYVDNLVHAIFLSLTAKQIDGEAFLVGDREKVTWADLYRPVAKALGHDLTRLPEGEPPVIATDWRNHFERVRFSKPLQTFLAIFPQKIRFAAYAAVASFWENPEVPSPWTLPTETKPSASLEMSLLYNCQYQLPWAKAEKMLGYQSIVSFAEACRRTTAWLAFAGYPVKDGRTHVRQQILKDGWQELSNEAKES